MELQSEPNLITEQTKTKAKELLWQKAQKVGFTADGLRQMLIFLNLNLHTMHLEELRDLWPYVNEINAKKF